MRRVSAMNTPVSGLRIEPAQAFRPFERDQGVGITLGDRRRPHLWTDPHMAEDDASALGHAVHFALLDLQALLWPSSAMTLDTMMTPCPPTPTIMMLRVAGAFVCGAHRVRYRVHWSTGRMQSEGQIWAQMVQPMQVAGSILTLWWSSRARRPR